MSSYLSMPVRLRSLITVSGRNVSIPLPNIPPEVADLRFEPDVEIGLFRLAQEAVNNAMKHSRARGITLSLKYDSGHLCFNVSDNGVGFDASLLGSNGLGIRSMKDRAKTLGGKANIKSSDEGTQVCVCIPTNPI